MQSWQRKMCIGIVTTASEVLPKRNFLQTPLKKLRRYKYKNEDKTPDEKDSLVAAEVKATLSKEDYTPIKNAIIASRKDEHRLARTVNYCRKRLKELGRIEDAKEVKRFLFKPDNNFQITYVAAGVSSRENVDEVIELNFSGEELEIRGNERIFYVHGKKLMELAHNIYERCEK